MNIEEYRAMVAQEAEAPVVTTEGGNPDVQVNEGPIAVPQQTVQTPGETNPIPEQQTAETEATLAPQTVTLNGVEVPVSEVEQGYLRQSDYTKKTQELARIKAQADVANKYYQAIQSDPEFAEGIARRFDLPYMSQEELNYKQLNDNYNNLILERDVSNLQQKYPDVNVQEVLKTAIDKRFENLEDAYIFNQAQKGIQTTPPDIESLREQIRQEVALELQSKVDTSTIIGTGGAQQQVQSNAPELSTGEMRVAQNMGLSAVEYAKWKNA